MKATAPQHLSVVTRGPKAKRPWLAPGLVRWALNVPAVAVTFAIPACIHKSNTNPAITITRAEAHAELKRLAAEPKALPRPVVLLNGYHTPHFMIAGLGERLRTATSGKASDFLIVSYVDATNLNDAAERVVRAVQERWPSSIPGETVPVDVVGLSMGGIVARLAALPARERPTVDGAPMWTGDDAPTGARLNVVRLFTLASPHGGARLARIAALDDAARAMRAGSAFLNRLDEALPRAKYTLLCYAHTGDVTVGARHAAPVGVTPIWTDGTVMFSHGAIVENPWFAADIARRLRGDEPLLSPGEPPPRD